MWFLDVTFNMQAGLPLVVVENLPLIHQDTSPVSPVSEYPHEFFFMLLGNRGGGLHPLLPPWN